MNHTVEMHEVKSAKNVALSDFIEMLINGEADHMSKGDVAIAVLDKMEENIRMRMYGIRVLTDATITY